MPTRTLQHLIPAVATTDGGGVKLQRSLGQNQSSRLDPFLMLDEFSSATADDYIAGFPAHPHRGFETVTYMLEGNMRHQDHLGNQGELTSGGAQWMTAGRGIIHSEMPQQDSGRMRGFQLWINLPAREKMQPPKYQDIAPTAIPTVELANGGSVRVLAGTAELDGNHVAGPIQGLSTAPLFLDVRLPANGYFQLHLNADHHAFVYPYEAGLEVGPAHELRTVPPQTAGLLSDGDMVEIRAPAATAFLLLAGCPLHEPIVQYGPFVMNTRAEIEQAIADYNNGQLV